MHSRRHCQRLLERRRRLDSADPLRVVRMQYPDEAFLLGFAEQRVVAKYPVAEDDPPLLEADHLRFDPERSKVQHQNLRFGL